MDTEAAQNLVAATSPQNQTTFVLRAQPMEFFYLGLLSCYLDRYSNFDGGSYPRQGFQHRHTGVGNRFPKCFRKKPRNRKGRHRE
jgi:hypothetical protein